MFEAMLMVIIAYGLGYITCGFWFLLGTHKKIYGEWIPKKENLPLIPKIKERLENEKRTTDNRR